MVTYLLLRDNKQSGPYALEELRTKGLKAYDLVWIEGKSAAWRYPSEIAELKPFAPIVEEQPYDRFFKKPSATITTTAASVNTPPRISTTYPAVLTGEPSTIPGKSIIYVTLPAGSKSGVLRESISTEMTLPLPVTEAKQTVPLSETIQNIVSDTPPSTGKSEYKLSRFVNQAPSTVELLPQSNQSGSRRILHPLGIAVTVLALLAAGVFIGLSINRANLSGFLQKDAAHALPFKAAQQLADNSTTTPAITQNSSNLSKQVPAPDAHTSASPAITVPDKGASSFAPEQPVTSSVTKTSVTAPPVKDVILTDKPQKQAANSEQKISAAPLPTPANDSATLSIPVAHRESIHRTDASPEKEAFRNNIANLVSVSANTYNVGTFGGISDLQLTVNNRSAFPLDLVVVEVQYVQANKKVFKKETLSFHNIGAGSALMLEAPKTSRGVKVAYKVTLISSKELGLSYSAI